MSPAFSEINELRACSFKYGSCSAATSIIISFSKHYRSEVFREAMILPVAFPGGSSVVRGEGDGLDGVVGSVRGVRGDVGGCCGVAGRTGCLADSTLLYLASCGERGGAPRAWFIPRVLRESIRWLSCEA